MERNRPISSIYCLDCCSMGRLSLGRLSRLWV
ncbi:hypothetical protein RHECNPAF_890024 [Rhizobium etli CNPAF512]|nr:hypothetical protein RHECNPAF_890024 [Rhizobium etli CNPAF512]